MGYTHYWKSPRLLGAKQFKLFVADVWLLLKALDETSDAGEPGSGLRIRIAGWDGKGKPEFSKDTVAFNGQGEQGYETFRVDRVIKGVKPFKGKYVEFCKTAHKAYDFFVCAALIALKRRFPHVEVSSDGDATDWKEGVEFYRRVLGAVPADGPWRRAERDDYWRPAT